MTNKPEKPVCKHCKSERVSLDAVAKFCVQSQEWELASTYDAAFCEDCEGETRLEWVQA